MSKLKLNLRGAFTSRLFMRDGGMHPFGGQNDG